MKLERRKFIRILGTGSLLFAANTLFVGCDKMPRAAVKPWSPVKYQDDRLTMLSYAILAPNPHNRQPWIVDLSEEGRIILYCDSERLLPETDPFSRQILIGHGAFLELLDVAASTLGYDTTITYFPAGEFDPAEISDKPVAVIDLVKNQERQPDPLFDSILHRRSTKEPFLSDSLSANHGNALQELLKSFSSSSNLTTDPPMVDQIKNLTWAAWKVEVYTARTYQESINLMRIGADEVAKNPDGIDIMGTSIWWGKIVGLLNRKTMADPESSAFQIGVDMYREMLENTTAYAWITTNDNSRKTQVLTGREYARLDLKSTQLGVRIHPISQILQEYPEMRDLQNEFLSFLKIPKGQTIQMLVRLGYADQPNPSPRHPVTSFVKS